MSTISNDQPSWRELLAGLREMLEHRQGKAGDGRIIAVVGHVARRAGRTAGRRSPRPTPASCRPRARPAAGPRPARCRGRRRRPARRGCCPGVTIPSRWPYSSWTSASGTSALRSTASASIASIRSGMTGAVAAQSLQDRASAPSSSAGEHVAGLDDADDIVDRAVGDRNPAVRRFEQRRADFFGGRSRCRSSRCRCAGSSPRAPAGRRAGRCRRSSPARLPRARRRSAPRRRPGAVPRRSPDSSIRGSSPSSLKISALVRSSSQTNGAVTFDSQRIGRDIDRRDRLGRAQRESAWGRSRRSPARRRS